MHEFVIFLLDFALPTIQIHPQMKTHLPEILIHSLLNLSALGTTDTRNAIADSKPRPIELCPDLS